MSLITLDFKLGLVTDKVRTLLGEFNKSCHSDMITYNPLIEFNPLEEKYFNCIDTHIFIFISDYYGSTPCFELTIIYKDHTASTIKDATLFCAGCTNIESVKVKNTDETEVRRASIIR